MSTTFRAAIVGTGLIGSTYDDLFEKKLDPMFLQGENRSIGFYQTFPINHAASYQSTPGFELVAAANRNEEKLRLFGERWGVKAIYKDFRKMLAEEKPAIVSVCVRSADKAEVTIGAAEAGVKAIIVEKPLATSLVESDAMLEACERNDVLLVCNHPYLFSSAIRKTKALIDEGAIGKLATMTAHTAGALLHSGTHSVDLLRYWGGNAAEVWRRLPEYAPDQDPNNVTAVFCFPNGATGFYRLLGGIDRGYEARGSAGYITISNQIGDGWLHRFAPPFPDMTGTAGSWGKKIASEPIEGAPHVQSLTQVMFSELYKTLMTGAPFISTGREAAWSMEMCIGCVASHLAGSPVKLPLSDRRLRVPNY